MRRYALLAITFAVLATSITADAQVTQTLGAGSAVTNVSATASFENQSALFDNPYVENGLRFSRTDLSFNNNGCGFAGCKFAENFAAFPGNYMYGSGDGFFTMQPAIGQRFNGLEFMLGSGKNKALWSASWTALLNGTEVGSGSIASFVSGQIVGFSSANGFDELRYTGLNDSFSRAPAFDEVRAQYATVVPEPSTWMLMASGLGMIAAYRRKRSGATV